MALNFNCFYCGRSSVSDSSYFIYWDRIFNISVCIYLSIYVLPLCSPVEKKRLMGLCSNLEYIFIMHQNRPFLCFQDEKVIGGRGGRVHTPYGRVALAPSIFELESSNFACVLNGLKRVVTSLPLKRAFAHA